MGKEGLLGEAAFTLLALPVSGERFEVLKGLIIFEKKKKGCTLLVLSAFVRIESIYSEQNHILRLFDLPESWRQWGTSSKVHRNEISVRAWEGADLSMPFQKLKQFDEPFEFASPCLSQKSRNEWPRFLLLLSAEL